MGLITDTDSVWGMLSIVESGCFWRVETGISGLIISVGLITDTDSGCFWRVETGISGLIISVGLIVDAESDCF
ncbi:hypothetical protein [Planktothrix agardhii]|uniref:Uncharacterized protein n=1 Tax=Planktothrix agardhii TaxID=1160 RepID=A0AAD1Q6A4_PLAAG|nr:hypothetical protein [Planktothrix agardhii]CAD5970334.1 hypothetical protein PANO66_03913 [Planktothrix agardhii]CAD5970390.1 hypothetical protein PANO66_03916 [Planktothrix agardhii]CAD5970424.1 hypothetical protein PANO66_03918 [Planktothrix agardhii]